MEGRSGQMERKTRTSKINRRSKNNDQKFHHPYEAFESTAIWKKLDKAVNELVKNKDIVETTRREYIVGYLCEALSA
jgi:hypothetical protein